MYMHVYAHIFFKTRCFTLFTELGLDELLDSYALLRRNHVRAGDFIIGYCWAAASMGSFSTLSVFYMNDHLKMSQTSIITVVLVVLVVGLFSGVASIKLMNKFGDQQRPPFVTI